MEEQEKDRVLTELFDKMSKISKIESPIIQMQEYLNLKSFLGDIWESGWNSGYEQGVKNWSQTIGKN